MLVVVPTVDANGIEIYYERSGLEPASQEPPPHRLLYLNGSGPRWPPAGW